MWNRKKVKKLAPFLLAAVFFAVPGANASFERETFFQNTPVPFSAEPPPHWHIYPLDEERWMGGDPTLTFNNPLESSVRITFYGLEKSRFKAPAEFYDFLKRVLNEPAVEKDMEVGGFAAKYFRFRYSYESATDVHGASMLAEAVYEEFVVVPLEKGFYCFNLTLRRVSDSPVMQKQYEMQGELSKNLRDIKDWNEFLASVRFQDKS